MKKLFNGVLLFSFFLAAPEIYAAPTLNLNTLKQLSTGTHQFEADSQTFNAYVDNDGTTGWLLVGRGRQGWSFTNGSQGTTASVSQNLGTSSAFTPAHYSSAIINDLITNSGIDLTEVEIRIRRATDQAGTQYQESRWRPISETNWRWDFDTPDAGDGSGFAVEYEIVSGLGAAFLDATSNTRDGLATPGTDTGNDVTRIFTWAWSGHANQQGFSFGSTVTNGLNNGTSFLWENANENHAMPYTEIFIRNINEPEAVPEPASIAIWSLLGLVFATWGCFRFRRQK